MSDNRTKPFAPPHRGTSSLAGKLSDKLSRFLARNIHTKTLPMRNESPLVTFTFDDVPASACSLGAPLLEQHGARGTFYVCGGGCGAQSPGGELASVEQLQVIHADGHEIGCHTFSHISVDGDNTDKIVAELERNQAFLKTITRGAAVRNFAYPYGRLSFRGKQRVEKYFNSCRSLIPGVNHRRADLGALKAWSLDNASIDRARISELLAATVKKNGWLIFCSHDVAAPPSRFGISPDLLEFAILAARAVGCRIVTIADGLEIAA
jgi:peptidoglycan/xylan/chitin deacetylase (PgdA/CDA1 family)